MPSIVKHYPTPSTTTYHIDKWLIDDIFRVDFQRKITDQPIWGYGSREFDFIARGREIVTGNIIINFRYPGYLRNLIELIGISDKKTARATQNAGINLRNNQQYGDHPSNIDAIRAYVSAEHVKETLSDMIEKAILEKKFRGVESSDLTSARIADSVNLAKKFLIEKNTPTSDKATALDLKTMASPLDNNEKLPTFNMEVRYGYQSVEGGFARRFNDINLIGESQVVQADSTSSAQPLMEIYPFFAKSISVVRFLK